MEDKLFSTKEMFFWSDIETSLIRTQYNEMLGFVIENYKNQYAYPESGAGETRSELPNFLNRNFCLTLLPCDPKDKVEKEDAKNVNVKKSFAILPSAASRADYNCNDPFRYDWFHLPDFFYKRVTFLTKDPEDSGVKLEDFDFQTHSLTVGAVIWLYFYERMGIFKILGVLLDDYNYKGKFTISGLRSTPSNPTDYSTLMDMICTLHRIGISSNLRDRVCLYQRVLGVSIANNLGIESERNAGFMNTFNRLIDYALEYYKTKQLAQAIQAQASPSVQPRSSVATQTSIKDTIKVLQQHFEPFQYGRNLINTFLGIATVHATLCLLNMVKTELGIPAQYNKPEEFIPAAYDILVAKRSIKLNEANRFIIFDNCASYGYRLLTDIEQLRLNELKTIGTGSSLDVWLNDIEGLVEGYRNAYSAVPEKVEAIV